MIIIAIGANLDIQDQSSKYETCLNAIRYLQDNDICDVIKLSDWYQTTAWPDPEKPPYINGVAIVDPKTSSPSEFLMQLHQVEAYFGRERIKRWEPRTLDLDLLLWNDYITENKDTMKGLALPHPRMAERYFVLVPLAQIAPNIKIPRTSDTCIKHLNQLEYNPEDISIYKKSEQI